MAGVSHIQKRCPLSPQALAFHRGKIVPQAEATVSIMTHAIHYGTAVFEGVRGNWNEKAETIYIFKLREHYERLKRGCKLLMLDIPYSVDDLCRITVDVVVKSGYRQDLYIRPIAYKSQAVVANLKLHELESDFSLVAVPFGKYVDAAIMRCCTSTWRRVTDTQIPPGFKMSALYVNSILAKTEAVLAGYDEAIFLNQAGYVCEGTGENLFLVRNGKLITPPLDENPLPGITRDTVMELAREELGIDVVERRVERTELYIADEVFLTGTAAHLTAVGELDHRKIAEGKVGPITKQLQDLYFDIIKGKNPKYLHWCTPAVPVTTPV